MSRAERATEAAALRAEGLLIREIAARMGISESYAGGLLNDPAGVKDRARKDSYRGVCDICGRPTDGSSGKANAPARCDTCYRAARVPAHGTLSRYQSGGCRCDECREANRLHMASLKGQPAPNHGRSGYVNYGCRCDVCRAAGRELRQEHPEYGERWRARVRGTEPPRHGYSTAYKEYGCRCDECRAWAAREYRARKKAAA